MTALRKLVQEEMVHGLPKIGQVGQLCEACQAGKQQRTSFLTNAEYRVERCLELVHGDLCGPISPATPRGNKYFLLLVDDLSKYMWVAIIPSNDRAATAIKDIQARAEGESGLKLKALLTDRRGGGDDIFTMEYTTTGPATPMVDGADEAPTEESLLPGGAGDMEVDDDVDDENLDADHDGDAPLCFCNMNDILATPGFAPRALVAEELHVVSSNEPASFAEAEHSPSWRKAMMEEMDSIEENGT
jgi:hypothetical protein